MNSTQVLGFSNKKFQRACRIMGYAIAALLAFSFFNILQAAPTADELQPITDKIWGWTKNAGLIGTGLGLIAGVIYAGFKKDWSYLWSALALALIFGLVGLLIQTTLGAPILI
jgi:hypothetical protein